MFIEFVALVMFYITSFLTWYICNEILKTIITYLLPALYNFIKANFYRVINFVITQMNRLSDKSLNIKHMHKVYQISDNTINDVDTGIWFVIGFRCVPYIKKLDTLITLKAIMGLFIFILISFVIVFLIVYFRLITGLINRVFHIITLYSIKRFVKEDIVSNSKMKSHMKDKEHIQNLLKNMKLLKLIISRKSTIKDCMRQFLDSVNNVLKSQYFRKNVNKRTERYLSLEYFK